MLLNILKPVFIILEVIVVFNLMIIVHELGHFLAARWRGLVIEKFGIWFGKPIWKKTINGVEYSLGSIPAGGFVALPQLAPMEVMEGKVETPREQLPPISALDKIIVAFAGPLFSFGLACVFAVIVWQVGRPVSESEGTRIVGFVLPDSPAAKAPGRNAAGEPLPQPGLQVGDEILEVDGRPVTRWGGMGADSITWRIVRSEGASVELKVKRGAEILTLYPDPKVPEKTNWWNRKGLRQIGIDAAGTPMVGKVLPSSPAEKAGLRANDIITAINGEKLFDAIGIYDYARKHPADTYTLTVLRGGETKQLEIALRGVKVDAMSGDPNSPARLAGVQIGDVVMGIDGQNLPVSFALTDYVLSRGSSPITLNIVRAGQPLDLKVTPQVPEQSPDGDKKPRIGVGWNDDDGIVFDQMGVFTVRHPAPAEQIHVSFMSIVNTLDAVLSRKSSIGFQHMGGPVMMMRAYYIMFENKEGWRMALWFSVVLNVNLALLNLLPIPVLDGGHITLAGIEALRRKPVNVRLLEYVQTACALVIIGFMLFIAFFDVQDLPWFGGGEKRVPMKFKAPSAEAQK
jgi:regulator of sigma E protease